MRFYNQYICRHQLWYDLKIMQIITLMKKDKIIRQIFIKMDNQFLSTPLLTSGKKNNKITPRIEKDELIRGLELKNNKLKIQIIKIQNVIDDAMANQPDQKSKERQPIMRSQQNQASMTKQLTNCYKRIKMYEYQINKIEEAQASTNVIQKAKQIQSIIKQKRMMADRLKAKLHGEQKIINENIKKLNNGSRQQEIQKKIKNLSDEIKFLQQKQKQQIAKQEIKQGNMKKQFEFIKKLQEELLELGVSHGELDEIKHRAIKLSQPPSISQSHVSKITNIHKKQQPEISIEDRTVDHYKQVQGEIKLLQKMQVDYEKKMTEAESEKEKAIIVNTQTRDRLLEIQDEIEKLERQILIQKGNVLPSNMKPLRPLRSVSSHYVSSDKKKINANNHSMNKGSKTLNHMLKFDEVGMTSDKGQRFTDRNILGKTNLMTKMTGLTIFINCQTKAISGVQAIYNHSKRGGQYLKKDREAKQKQYDEEKITCNEGEWFKSITGTLTPQDKLQSLYVITNKGQSKRFGDPKTTNKSFSFDIGPEEVPVCIFGSLLVFKEIGKPENSIVEHFGIQINAEKGKKTQVISDSLEF